MVPIKFLLLSRSVPLFMRVQCAERQDYEEHHTDTTVFFRIHMTEANLRAAEQEGLEKRFKMTSNMSTSNMVCFDLNGKIRKYSSPEEILIDFYHKRLEFYGLRKVCFSSQGNENVLTISNTSQTS